MPALSTRAARSVEAFAASMGLPATPAGDGSYSFRFRRSGTVTITPAANGSRAMFSLAWSPSRADRASERLLLELAGPDPSSGRFIQSGMATDGSFVCAVAIDDNEMDLPVLDQWLRRLMEIRDGFG